MKVRDILEYKTREILFHDFISELAEKSPDSLAISCDGVTVRYKELKEMADLCSSWLINAGVKKGDKVALWSYNNIPWIVSFLGIIGAGAVAVLMNYGLKKEDAITLMKGAKTSWLIIGSNSISKKSPDDARSVALESGIPADHILHVADFQQDIIRTMNQKPSKEEEALLESIRRDMNPHDTQVIIFTTGTSSLPKMVQLSSFSILNDAISLNEMHFPEREPLAPPFLLALPLFHSYGLMMFFYAMAKTAHIHLSELLKPELINNLIDEYKIHDMASVGAVYDGMTQLPDFDEKVAGKMRYLMLGGGFETPLKIMRLENAFAGAKFISGYGQSECSPAITFTTPKDSLKKRSTTVGRPLPGLEVRIWNKEKGFLPQGEVGEVVVKGFCQMNGYYDLPAERQSIDADGWLHTEDLGFLDEDGFLQLTGRIKDIIIRGGENISPSEIESILLSDTNIRSAKVIGAPHTQWGESVEACLVVDDIDSFDEEALRAMLAQKVSSYKIPSHFILYPAFPLSENGKLDIRSLRKDMLHKLSRISTRDALQDGICILSLSLQEQNYTINLASSLVDGLTMQFQYGAGKIIKIRSEVQYMLRDVVRKAHEAGGKVRMDIILTLDSLRFSFISGMNKSFYQEMEESYGPETINASIEHYSVEKRDNDSIKYHLEYPYSEDFNVIDYLLQNWDRDRS